MNIITIFHNISVANYSVFFNSCCTNFKNYSRWHPDSDPNIMLGETGPTEGWPVWKMNRLGTQTYFNKKGNLICDHHVQALNRSFIIKTNTVINQSKSIDSNFWSQTLTFSLNPWTIKFSFAILPRHAL